MRRPLSLEGLITAAGVLGLLATAVGFLGELSWVLDLFTHLRFHLAVGLGVLTLWCAMRRMWGWTFGLGAGVVVNLALVLPWLLTGPPAGNESAKTTISLMLLNVNTTTGDPQNVADLIRREGADVVVLQEISPRWVDPGLPTLLAGDVNLTPWTPRFHRLLEETDLVSAKRGWGMYGTWPHLPGLFRIPLDHVLHSRELRISEYRVGGRTGSDHLPVFVRVAL